MQQITSITPTICRLMRIPPPSISTRKVIPSVLDACRSIIGNQSIEKCFVYAPDALGEALFREFVSEFGPVTTAAPVQVLLRSVFPPKTPVCYASMFTGALPEVHGITRYEKPVLGCDTLFDALLKEGKKVAIVAVADCSVARIFLNRPLDYFIEEHDQRVNDRVLRLLSDGDHDFILAYNQGYDDALHRTTPRSGEAMEAMRGHIRTFEKLARAFKEKNDGYNRLILFSPDHGSHVDPETGRGDHGLDIPEDMDVRSFWGVYGIDN